MSSLDHSAQDALERLTAIRLQEMAERRDVAIASTAATQRAELRQLLVSKGLTWKSLLRGSTKACGYSLNLRQTLPVFFDGLLGAFPDARFAFTHIGAEGRVAQIKGDCEIVVAFADGSSRTISLSLKNYLNGPGRIQVGSRTYQSFALGFFLESIGISKWRSPVDGSEYSSQRADFHQWRDRQLEALVGAASGAKAAASVVALFHELDDLHASMRGTFLDGEDFRFYDEDRAEAVRRRTGLRGADVLRQVLGFASAQKVREVVFSATGLFDGEDLLVFGNGLIADTVTDPAFKKLTDGLRNSSVRVAAVSQTLRFEFLSPVNVDEVVFTVEIPCTVNSNGAWFRDGDPYEGTRYHAKEKRDLAWGERRPKKCREIATSTNTYINLAGTGLLRPVRERVAS